MTLIRQMFAVMAKMKRVHRISERNRMLLTIDIGNTNMVLGVFEGDTIVEHWRIATVPDRTADEIAALLHGLLARSTVVKEWTSRGSRCAPRSRPCCMRCARWSAGTTRTCPP